MAIMRRLGCWLADALRFFGALYYWNIRKAVHRWRPAGGDGRSPCQNESDDSIPGRVRCEAVLHWHEPGRFRQICPLLVSTSEGWRCSVHAAQVRPFWGRVFGWTALAFLTLYLAGTFSVFAAMRLVGGVPVKWVQVAWPANWREIRAAQSNYLFGQAMLAFGRGRLAEAYLSLSSARQRDPSNYEATLLLAQIAMFQHSYLFSDELFGALAREHPENGLRTAVVYHDTLLALDRMDRLARFCLAQATTDLPRAAVWVRSALLAIRVMRADEAAGFGASQAAVLQALAPHARLLLQAELDLRTGNETRAIEALRRRFEGPFNLFYSEYQIQRLAGLGGTEEAQLLLDQLGPYMGEFDHLLTQADLSSLTGDRWAAHGAFRSLLKQPLNGPRVERLAGLLIKHPTAELYRELHVRIHRETRLEAAVDDAAMWTAGIVCAAPEEARFWQMHGRQPALANYPDIRSFDFGSRDLTAPDSVCHLINVTSLPREVIMALLWRMTPQATSVSHRRSGT